MFMVSCNHKQHGLGATSGKNDTVICKSIKLAVKTVDEKGNDLPNFKANYYIHDGIGIIDWEKTPFEKCINSTASWSVITIQGERFQTELNLNTGIDQDMTIVFVVKSCK